MACEGRGEGTWSLKKLLLFTFFHHIYRCTKCDIDNGKTVSRLTQTAEHRTAWCSSLV